MDAPESLPAIVEYYREFRTAIFLSSLTLGTFLFTMKTFIVQTMKTDVYDDPDYQKDITYRISQGHKESYYGSLKWFSRLIMAAILLAFLSAFLQISIGYSRNADLVWFCLATALLSWLLVALVLFLVSSNLSSLLDRAEKKAVERNRGCGPKETKRECCCKVDGDG